jgi:dTDP-4-dehydrorhamnose 3,5-epimerase
MIFESLELRGAWLIRLEPSSDNRGHFARTFCELEFGHRGLETHFSQHSTSYTRKAGTIRGLHYQKSPDLEAKVVRCVRGAIYDVIVDLSRDSPTFGRWTAVELSEESGTQLYIPRGFAHGFQSIRPDAELHYMISTPFVPEKAAGIRYDDATLAITWPLAVTNISDRDRALPRFDGSPID